MLTDTMDGNEFYNFLQDTFQQSDEVICDNFTFKGWIPTEDGSKALRFGVNSGDTKFISKDILIAAWEADGDTDDGLSTKFPNDCRLQLLNCLIDMCSPLRKMSA